MDIDIQFLLSLVGASAWLAPYVYRKLTRPSLKGKLVSLFANSGSFNQQRCLLYFVALNVISLHRHFNIKETQITIRYKSSANEYSGKLYWARTNHWVTSRDEHIKLIVPPEEMLPFVGTIPPNMTKKIYATFRVDKAELEDIEELKIIFVEESGKKSTVSIKQSAINEDLLLWDDRIWQPRLD